MATYLLSWNPKHFTSGGDGSVHGKLNYQDHEIVQWSCHSKQVKVGDSVYLIKVGDGNRGLIAKGLVTKASYQDTCWKDPSKLRTYIDVELETLRQSCAEGIVPQVLLQAACPEQQWSPQSSGISIKPQYQSIVDEFWKLGASLHSLSIYFNWIKNYKFNPESWYNEYVQMCEMGQTIKQENAISHDQLELIWAKRINGVSSVGQGFMYKSEFEAHENFLRTQTLNILREPTSETYSGVIKQWKTEGQFKRVLWSVIRRVFALADPKQLTSIVGDEYLNVLFPLLNEQFELEIKRSNNWIEDNAQLIQVTSALMPPESDVYIRNILLWCAYEYSQNSRKELAIEDESDAQAIIKENSNSYLSAEPPIDGNINQILYGPPGTGKTYRTVQMAVDAAEPEFVATGGTRDERRAAYKEKYDELFSEGRIRFVTFHQSYGYEEFVEGLKASSEDGNISYDVEDGVFKKIALQAQKFMSNKSGKVIYDFDKAWQIFTESLAEEEYLEIRMAKSTFRVLDFNDKRILFEKHSGSQDHTLSISTLKAIFEGEREFNSGLGVYYRPLVKYLKSLIPPEPASETKRKHFVLIIDEINRGNISKVFGELITLVETSKRLGQSESLKVTLPYSGDELGIPDNLYLLGTMNTADRSLALMDTALRRRFEFVEMMPDYSALIDEDELPYCIVVDEVSIDLVKLLKTLNTRIAALYDREHTLGHAFIMPVISAIKAGNHEAALSELAKCFQHKLIPLLAEYFFEDWQKIRLVLGDNQKERIDVAQIIERHRVGFDELFGDACDIEFIDDEVHEYRLKEKESQLWDDPLTFVGVYDLNQLAG